MGAFSIWQEAFRSFCSFVFVPWEKVLPILIYRNGRPGQRLFEVWAVCAGVSGWGFSCSFSRFVFRLSRLLCFSQPFYNGEFDPGSGWTLATGLTHASRGETALSACTLWTSTGARVSNAYPTFPLLWDNLPKGRLIPHGLRWRHQIWSKDLSVMDGDASD